MPTRRPLARSDTILTERSPLWCVLACGSIAALPVLLALLTLIALLLVASVAGVGVVGWFIIGVVAVFYACLVGAGTALLYRWPRGVSRWGDMVGGLLLWPASFPPVYTLVATMRAFVNGTRPGSWPAYLSTQWELDAIEAVSYAAVFATMWFASWRILYPRLLRQWSGVDERDVMAELLRRHYRQHTVASRNLPPVVAAGIRSTRDQAPRVNSENGSLDASS